MVGNKDRWISITAGVLLGLLAAAAPSQRLLAAGEAPSATTVGASAASTSAAARRALRLGGGQLLALSSSGTELRLQAGASSSTRTWALPETRRNASLTRLPDGRVLIWGGQDSTGGLQRDGLWFDPELRTLEPALRLPMKPRSGHTATVLTDGRVLFAGGATDTQAYEIWDPRSGKWNAEQTTATLTGHRALLRTDGKVSFTTGGNAVPGVRQELLFDPADDQMAGRGTLAVPVVADGLAGSFPEQRTANVSIDAVLSLRFSDLVRLDDLNSATVTLFGPGGATGVRVTSAEDGRLAFVHPLRPLFPDAPYTLMVKGVSTQKGKPLPLMTLDFRTAALSSRQGSAGEAHHAPVRYCDGRTQSVQLCQGRGEMREGIWTPGQDNAGENWRLPGRQPEPTYLGMMPKIFNAWGKSALTGTVLRADGAPVAGVAVSVGSIAGYTNAKGQFLLYDVPKGRQRVYVDGTAANAPGLEYGQFVVGVDVESKGLTQVPFTLWLPRIAQRDKIQISSPTTREQVLTHPDLPGMELRIPAGTVIRDQKGKIVTEVAIVPTPVNRSPYPLPTNFPMYFTLQPGGAVLQGLTPEAGKGARVIYPNYDKHPEGTLADFWLYDAMEGWRVYGQGRVNKDETQFIPEPGVALHEVVTFGAAVSPNDPAPEEGMPPDDQECGECSAGTGKNATAGDPIDLRTGRFSYAETDIAITDVLPITLGRNYRPSDRVKREFGIGTSAGFMYRLAQRNSYAQLQLVLPNGTPLVFNRTSGSGAYGTWRYSGAHEFSGATIASGSSSGWKYLLTMRDGSQMTFDSHSPNRIKTTEDRFGNVVEYQYDAGNVSRILSPNGRYIDLNYDTQNRITSAVDPLGATWRYEYNTRGMLTKVIYPDNTSRRYEYRTYSTPEVGTTAPFVWNLLSAIYDQRGNRMLFNEYDSIEDSSGTGIGTSGKVVRQTLADGAVYEMQYDHVDGNTRGTLVTYPDGSQRRVEFNGGLYPTSDTLGYGSPIAQSIRFERDASDRITARVDPIGRRTEYVYDSWGQLARRIDLAGTSQSVTFEMSYNEAGNVTAVVDPLGRKSKFEYAQGCLVQVINPLQNSTHFTCNESGQLETATDALSNQSVAYYFGSELAAASDALGRITSYRYDALGRMVAVEGAAGDLTRIEHDVMGRVSKITSSDGSATEYAYDANGNISDVLLPHQNGISYEYDSRDRLIKRTDSLGHVESWVHDGMGRWTQSIDRNQRATQQHYDALGRPTVTIFNDGSSVTASYDGGDRRIALVDSASGAIAFQYDGLDRVVQVSSQEGVVAYAYDAAGRRTSMIVGAQGAVEYTYDDGDRLIRLAQGEEVVEFSYDAIDRLTALRLPNQVQAAYSYNAGAELNGIAWTHASQGVIGTLGFNFNASGKLNAQSGSYASATLPEPVTSLSQFDDSMRQLSYQGRALHYDPNGNLLSDGEREYVWNARNQLAQVREGGIVVAEYRYDAMGRRVISSERGRETTYLYDGLNPVQEVQAGVVNPILTGLAIDQRFARNEGGVRTYFLTDHLGSTRALTDGRGEVLNRYDYDPYGRTIQSEEGFTNPYQYTGREHDATGLYYYRARYYHPGMGRFIAEDPIGLRGGRNTYAYVDGDPLNFTDPLGLSKDNWFNPYFDPIAHSGARADRDRPGIHTIYAHGGPDSINLLSPFSKYGPELNAAQAAEMIRRSNWNGQPVWLKSCNTGKKPNGFAQQLANELGVTVWAPNTQVWFTRKGVTGAMPRIGGNGKDPDYSNPGYYSPFYPKSPVPK
jgi:RHS repeat-associated protein